MVRDAAMIIPVRCCTRLMSKHGESGASSPGNRPGIGLMSTVHWTRLPISVGMLGLVVMMVVGDSGRNRTGCPCRGVPSHGPFIVLLVRVSLNHAAESKIGEQGWSRTT